MKFLEISVCVEFSPQTSGDGTELTDVGSRLKQNNFSVQNVGLTNAAICFRIMQVKRPRGVYIPLGYPVYKRGFDDTVYL